MMIKKEKLSADILFNESVIQSMRIHAIDNVRTKAIRYALAFGWVLVAGLIVVKLVISLLIGA